MKEESCEQQGLYRSEFEHDACGVGFVADIGGKPDHSIVTDGLTILKRLMHRGATGNDSETGDGAGILVRIPDAFFRKHIANLPPSGEYGVAMIFGGKGAEEKIENIVKAEGLSVIAWREVPVDPTKIGHDARSVMPIIRQLFVKCTVKTSISSLERKLMVVRRLIEKEVEGAYLCSFSTKTIVYKGLLLATQMEAFYPDLGDADFISSFAIVHQRYSTNTFPSWPLAHPFRALAHNGEINALKGNLNALSARESTLKSAAFGEDLKKLFPLVKPGQSDSASLDNMFELLVAAGRDAPHAMLMLLPQAWGQKYHMGHDVRGFYEYHSALMEPWDGPAAVAFTDGTSLGATLDRNGLRPARWTLSKSGRFVLASEAGVLDIPAEEVERRGRLKPGSILWLDLEKHRLLEDNELKTFYARKSPYRRWVEENRISIQGLFTEITPSKVGTNLEAEQKFFGYTLEDLNLIMKPMAETGHEAVGAMGNDAALAMLSKKPRLLFDYFKQLFAQVTNPPIDPIREELVMSLMTYIGNLGNILEETQEHARLIKLRRPIVTDDELRRLVNAGVHGFESIKIPIMFSGSHSGADLRAALRRIAETAEAAAREGKKIIILSDHPSVRKEGELPIPSLLATAAVNHALVKSGLRPSVGVIVESGEVREVMHYALLLGFGATAINPYLALETVSSLFPEDMVKAASNYVTAIDKGLLKIMSKMGISTLRSYRSAQIFEAVGLSKDVAREFFGGVTSPVGGIGLDEIAEAVKRRVGGEVAKVGGEYRLRKNGEDHLWTSEALTNFRLAVRSGDYDLFKKYTAEINDPSRHQVTLRSRFRFKPTFPIPLSEVEPVESIVKRFMGGAMSLGSLSPEAHETIAIALNELGTMSNSGEGGENSERFGTNKNCGIKQVASGRFGVTIEYLRNAKDLQIKLAQGAKPGEGGQLPAHKVNEFVAKLRHAKPGTTLISPPPHHDIYSIEDLAQLIYDLQCANPKARVSVKLVSEAGVGTIAAGVAKAHADVVLISGFDGGTGAAPLTSMKHAGLPWELGLAEAQQTLIKNGLRGRVKLQVDGQLRTGRDIVIGAMLGADEFGFGTTMLVALGCVQCRNCNLNTCPVGIATQRKELRACFEGKKEHLQNYFRFLAEETREVLASLGLRSIEEAIGRADLLTGDEKDDFSAIFYRENGTEVSFNPYRVKEELENYDRKHFAALLAKPEPAELELEVSNVNRTVGTELSGAIAEKYGAAGLPDESIKVHFHGTGGQSFGAFLAHGVTFTLEGAANDYVGKGLSGGVIVIKPEKTFTSAPEDSVIAGNVIAYGATSGKIFINGQAGERFAIRNSGVTLVAEGIGDHGCEYMTGGKVVVLGSVGVNFAAGMTGGVAYVYDERGVLDLYSNLSSIDLSPVEEGSEAEAELLGILAEHIERTSSPKAKRIIENWTTARPSFVKVVPVKE